MGRGPALYIKGPPRVFLALYIKGASRFPGEHLVPGLCDAEFQEVFFFLERKVMSRELHLHSFFSRVSFPPLYYANLIVTTI